MDYNRILLIVCVGVFLAVGIPAALYMALRRESGAGQIELFRRAARGAQRPWGKEDDDLQELSRRIKALDLDSQRDVMTPVERPAGGQAKPGDEKDE